MGKLKAVDVWADVKEPVVIKGNTYYIKPMNYKDMMDFLEGMPFSASALLGKISSDVYKFLEMSLVNIEDLKEIKKGRKIVAFEEINILKATIEANKLRDFFSNLSAIAENLISSITTK